MQDWDPSRRWTQTSRPRTQENQGLRCLRVLLQRKPPHTCTLDAVAEVVCEIVHDVQQEGEVGYVVHVDGFWF